MDQDLLELLNDTSFSLGRIRTFLRVAEAGSVAKAVKNDAGQQSQFSREIKQLSEWAGAELFEKAGRTKVLSAAGKELQQLLLGPLKNLCEFRQRIKELPTTIQIGTGAALLHWWILPRIKIGQMTHYRLCNQRNKTICEWLNDSRLDFGVIEKSYLQNGFGSKNLGKLDYALFVPIGLLNGSGADDIASVLKRVPLAVLGETSTLGGQIMGALYRIEPKIQISVVCDSMPTAAAALSLGQCGAVLPKKLGRYSLSDQFKRFDHAFFKELSQDYVLAWARRAAAIRPSLKTMAESLVEMLHFSRG